ncbi:MAG TPA: hypothetical protein PLY93_04685 [Turneriella sp.]|nr:hypothetical protein [Turneriella sp.]
MIYTLRTLVCFVLVFGASSLYALGGESLYVKAFTGGAYSSVVEKADDIKISFSGFSGLSYLQLGGALTPSLKIFGFTGVAVAPSPKAKTENLKIDTVYNMQMLLDFGMGFAYYTKGGLFFSFAGSLAQNYYKFSVYGSDVGLYTRHGWGSQVMVGYEIPISPRWSYGVSGVFYYGQVKDTGPVPYNEAIVWNMYFGLVVSITYD